MQNNNITLEQWKGKDIVEVKTAGRIPNKEEILIAFIKEQKHLLRVPYK